VCSFALASSGQARRSNSDGDSFCRDRIATVTSKVAVRFITNRESYSAGETAMFRIDNVGGVPIRLIGEYFSLERFADGQWRVAPESPHAFSKIRLGILEPGKSGFCRVFRIPSNIAPGHYRFRKVVTISSSHKQRRLFAGFHITAGEVM